MVSSDKEIINAIRKNPERGFHKLMSIYMQPVYWHIRRMVVIHADAEDAAQETFVRAFRSFNQFDEQNSLKAWIFRIATNEALRLLGKKGGKDTVSLDNASGIALSLKEDGWFDDGDALAARLQRAILSLPTKQQMTFNLRYYDDMSYAEIAEVTDSSEAAAKANYHVAKEKIIQFMKHND